MTKIAGSGSISQRHGSADPDSHQNVMSGTLAKNPYRLEAQEAVVLGKESLDLVALVAELGDVPADAELVHPLGQLHQALPRNYCRQHQVVDLVLAPCTHTDIKNRGTGIAAE